MQYSSSLALALLSGVGRQTRELGVDASGAVHRNDALPAIVLTPGTPVVGFGGFVVTAQGLRGAAYLLSRAETAATLSALLVLTTPWPWVLKALRVLKCPTVLVSVLGMTYRYIFEILRAALDMFEARRSRTVGTLSSADNRRLAVSAIRGPHSKSFQLSGDVHMAMQSRGFRGEVHVLPDFRAGVSLVLARWFRGSRGGGAVVGALTRGYTGLRTGPRVLPL